MAFLAAPLYAGVWSEGTFTCYSHPTAYVISLGTQDGVSRWQRAAGPPGQSRMGTVGCWMLDGKPGSGWAADKLAEAASASSSASRGDPREDRKRVLIRQSLWCFCSHAIFGKFSSEPSRLSSVSQWLLALWFL